MLSRIAAHRSLIARVLFLAMLLGVASSETLMAQGAPCGIEGFISCMAWGMLACHDVCGSEHCCGSYHDIGDGMCVCSMICDCNSNQ